MLKNLTPQDRQWLAWLITLALVVVGTLIGVQFPIPPTPTLEGISAQGVTNFDQINISAGTAVPTNVPAAVIDSDGVGNVLEILAGGTPAVVVGADGNTTISGTCTGCSIDSGSGLRITQPTAATTATPALAVNSLAAGAKLVEVMDATTPVYSILNGGAVVQVGARTASGGDTVNNWHIVSAPTAIATSTPAAVIDSLGVSTIWQVRDAATPQVSVHDGGDLDVHANKIDLDADNDTSITADTDDQIDIEISGADDFQFTANVFTVLAGSKINSASVTTGTHGIVFNCSAAHGHASAETGVSMCSLPANANVVDVLYNVSTQWNDGTGAAVDCGIEGGDVDAFVDAMNINDAADVNRMGDAADMPIAASFIDIGASDVDVICQVAETDDDASAGAATLVLWYIID